MSDPLTLEIIEGPGAGRSVVVDKPLLIGRGPESGFVLDDREVSRKHLQLTPSGDHLTVEDLGSANGTFINENELHGPARMDPGDQLLAGVTVMELRDRELIAAQGSGVVPVPAALAIEPRTPTYADPDKVNADVHEEHAGIPELDKYRDVRVRRRALNAPWLLLVLDGLALAVYLLTR